MFSTAMPILYPFAFVFYVVLFIIYKFLLLFYYQKTTQFNHELPMLATSYIKVGIFLHIAFGAIMVTNSDIIPSHDLQVPKEGEDYNSWSFFMRERFWSKSHGTIYAIFCISLVIFLVLKNTILKAFYELAKCLYQKYYNLD